MTREEQMKKIVGQENLDKAEQLIEEVVFIEEQLRELKKLPFLKVHPKDKTRQKPTASARLYKELLQQYNNSLKLLFRITGETESDEESPLRRWVKERGNKDAD